MDQFDGNKIYQRYYEIMEDMTQSDLFTQIGHPDQLKLFHYVSTYDLIPIYERMAYLAKKHPVKMKHNTGIHYQYQHKDIGTNPIFLKIKKIGAFYYAYK